MRTGRKDRGGKAKPANAIIRAGKHVQLKLHRPTARSVCIAGTFNDWHPTVTEMIKLSDGQWAKELVLAPGVYEYLFVADAEWIPDPAAVQSAPNPFGGVNSVLRVVAD